MLLKPCANGRNIVGQQLPTLLLIVWPLSNFAQQLPTARNNMQKGVQTDAKSNIQQCCVRLHGALGYTGR